MVNFEIIEIPAGLYFVATPIGAARDITLRALDLLASADRLMAEDTRSLRHLMQIHGVPLGERRIVSYHDHSAPAVRQEVVEAVLSGQSVVYASEAGTPLIADPGFALGRAVAEAGGRVSAAPGASAALAALTISGLPSDRFLFCGFPPQKSGLRKSFLSELEAIKATVIFYESPKRVRRLLDELCEIWDADRPAALCRELTKRFEEVRRGSLQELRESLGATDPKGECVLLVGRGASVAADAETIAAALDDALSRLTLKDAAREVAEIFELPRREIYQQALARQKERGE